MLLFSQYALRFILRSDPSAKSGQHDTTVHEKVAPAVVHENIQKQKHEEVTTAIDREVHQDHYHTTVQPVHDRQVLPEEHHNRVIPVEHREHDHGKHAVQELKQGLEQERAQFQSTRSEAAAKESHSTNASVVGEHVHHHVHEVRIEHPLSVHKPNGVTDHPACSQQGDHPAICRSYNSTSSRGPPQCC